MSITIKDLLPKDVLFEQLDADKQANLRQLQQALTKFFDGYAGPLIVTSGLRSMKHHLQVYADINATRARKGLPSLAVPMASKHLHGQAADLYDPKSLLKKWTMANIKRAEELGLYFEDFAHTANWLHVQIVPPKSRNRFFKP